MNASSEVSLEGRSNRPAPAGQLPPRHARRYPLERGTMLALGTAEALLWTAGDAPEATGGRPYLKEGKGIPDPIMLVRHAGHGGWEDTAGAVLGLTKMNWNNDALYDRMPVTLGFASPLAHTAAHMTQLNSKPLSRALFHLERASIGNEDERQCAHGRASCGDRGNSSPRKPAHTQALPDMGETCRRANHALIAAPAVPVA